MNSQPPAKGSLEELFRQHLLESEAAAVPPRPLVWEQLDNTLLLAQNEKYRRRLLVHRWAVAASLLLATLASGGWWHSRQATTAGLANATPQGRPTPLAGARAARVRQAATHGLARAANLGPALPTALGTSTTTDDLVAGASATPASAELSGRLALAQPSNAAGWGRVGGTGLRLTMQAGQAPGLARAGTSAAFRANAAAFTSFLSSPNAAQPIATTTTSSASRIGSQGSTLAAALPAGSAALGAGEALLASRLVSLPACAPGALPPALALADVPQRPATKPRRWQFGVEYAATAFQPNVDFNGAAASYPTAASYTSASITRAAAAEYRANLRAGLGQRLSLRATRWLGGHWSLSTGLEAAQQEATSATSTDFVGAPLAALNASTLAPRVLRSSSYRYRSAGIPVELRYGNPVKTGLSFYGRVGAVVSALLNVRSEVASNPEATRTYSLFSAGSPYRRVAATVRGAAGVEYRPARHHWALNLGPMAEAGVQSLNADSGQSFWSQQRPYSFGLEAGVELGGGLRVQ